MPHYRCQRSVAVVFTIFEEVLGGLSYYSHRMLKVHTNKRNDHEMFENEDEFSTELNLLYISTHDSESSLDMK